MKILVTNDDGILAPGLAALCRYLGARNEVFAVAPDNERSGVSQSITYRRPVFHKAHVLACGVEGLAINGFPVDCVKVALHSLCPWVPDLVVSGINAGLNVGLNVSHSGTVSAALAASVAGLPAVAISLEEAPVMDFDAAIEAAWPVCEELLQQHRLAGRVLNVNIPSAALLGTARYAIVPVNTNNMGYHFAEGLDPKGRPWLWQTNDPAPQPLSDFCDVYLCRAGAITISPLSVDLTCHETLRRMQGHYSEKQSRAEAGTNGSAANGTAANGSAANGTAANGVATNGAATNAAAASAAVSGDGVSGGGTTPLADRSGMQT